MIDETAAPSGYVRLALIHRGRRHEVSRARRGQRTVVVKTVAAGTHASAPFALLRHEHELLRAMRHPSVVEAIALEWTPAGPALVMADAGAGDLRARLSRGRMELAEVFDLACALAEVLRYLHEEARVVHRDVNPANIVWSGGRLTLIDFGIATALRVSAPPADHATLEGTLPYLSPEQTGRTGRAVDERTDHYALGVTLYEVLTGGVPFASSDPLEVIHAHLAQRPVAPRERDPRVPEALSDIVLKLLAKTPEDRYQTASALLHDLETARATWQRTGDVASFPLAASDLTRELRVPDKLYGRDSEVAALREALSQAAQGRRVVRLIAGPAGIGKSALVDSLLAPTLERDGRLVRGKFDQLQRARPYSALVDALRALVLPLLAEPEAELAVWRARLVSLLGANAVTLASLVPELEHVLGPQPPSPELAPSDARDRLVWAAQCLVRAFARADHPLVIALDDLQWADAASLYLIERLLTDDQGAYLLIVGAYRESDIGRDHPLRALLRSLAEAPIDVATITPTPLALDALGALCADTLRCDSARALALAEVLERKTAGNPFFIARTLRSLHDDGQLRWDGDRWSWDLDAVQRVRVADNVVSLLSEAIVHLPDATRELLEVGACLGNRFDLETLAAASQRSLPRAADDLWPALVDGLLHPLGFAARMPRHEGPMDDRLAGLPASYQFAHDRVQQAAYELVPAARRPALHLVLGRILRAAAGDDGIFDTVDQLNRGAALLADESERVTLADLNLRAGRKARDSAAYETALAYLSAGLAMLPPGDLAWRAQGELCFALHRDRAEAAYLAGQHQLADALFDAALAHCPTRADRVSLCATRVVASSVAGDFVSALRWGRDGLALLDTPLPDAALADAIEAEMSAVGAELVERGEAALLDAPSTRDPDERARMRLLGAMVIPAYVLDQELLAYVLARMVSLTFARGSTPESAPALVFYGAVVGDRRGDYETGYALGRLGVSLARRVGDASLLCRALQLFGTNVNHWRAPLRTSAPLLREAQRLAFESGDLQYAAYAGMGIACEAVLAGRELDEALHDVDASLAFARRQRNEIIAQDCVAIRQAIRHLLGRTRAPGSFEDDDHAEAPFIASLFDTPRALYECLRLQAAYLLGDLDAAARASAEVSSRRPFLAGFAHLAEWRFYAALTAVARLDRAAPDERQAIFEELASHEAQLSAWARHCPENYAHKRALVAAERARHEGDRWAAAQGYHDAFEGARAQGLLADAALSAELAGRFFLAEGQRRVSDVYLASALAAWRRWGAKLAVDRLIEAFPHLGDEDEAGTLIATRGFTTTSPASSFDVTTVIRASQAVAGETAPDRLLLKILQIVVETAGAERGVLVLEEGGSPVARARCAVGVEATPVREPCEMSELLPRAALDYVWRTREALVLADASLEGPLAASSEVRERGVRSVLCVPLRRQARMLGVIYLENNLIPHAFSRGRVEMVRVLATQATISLESSQLVAGLQREVAERERAEAELQALNHDLERRIHERSNRLVQAEKMAGLGQMVAGVAHEINNPLSFVINNLAVLQRDVSAIGEVMGLYAEGDATLSREAPLVFGRIAEARERLDVSYSLQNLKGLCDRSLGGLRRIQRIVSDLRGFARLDESEWRLADLNEGIESTLHIVRGIADRRGVEVVTELAPLPLFECNAAKIHQVVMNLTSNAIDACARGGRVVVRSSPEGDGVRIEVRDTGHGISPSIRGRIFDPFFTTKPVGAGTGLGLSISYGIVKDHGGTIDVDSTPGEGSSFVVHLPRRSGPATLRRG